MVGIFTVFALVIGSFFYAAYFNGVGGSFYAIMFVAGFGGIGALIGYIIDILRKKLNPKKEVAASVEQTNIIKEKPFVYGFGGWLYSFSVLLLYLLYFASTAIYENYQLIKSPEYKQITTFGFEYYNALLHPAIIMEIIVQSVVVIMILFIAYCFYKQKKIVKKIVISLFLILLLFNIVDLFLLLSIQNTYPEKLIDDTLYDGVFLSFAYSIVWIPYFLISKRVKNTFIM